jgi:hypothetical protein
LKRRSKAPSAINENTGMSDNTTSNIICFWQSLDTSARRHIANQDAGKASPVAFACYGREK